MKTKIFIMVTLLIICTNITNSIPCSMGTQYYDWECQVWQMIVTPNDGGHSVEWRLEFIRVGDPGEPGYSQQVFTKGINCSIMFRGNWEILNMPNGQKLLSFQLHKDRFSLTYDYIGHYNICGNALILEHGGIFEEATFTMFNVTELYEHCWSWDWPWYVCQW
jgi:hypothetical protein